jgi:long-chain fatty acid transport protein
MKMILSIVAVFCLISFIPSSVYAVGGGGFENASFSAKQLAMGGGGTATPDEPAAISYNPAGIVDLPGVQFQGNTHFISNFTFKDNDVTGDTRSSGTVNFFPTGYLTINPGKIFCDRFAFGVGSDTPFGLSNKYNSDDPAAHYTGWRNYLKMFTIKPTIAVKVLDNLSIGGGPMWYRIYDFGGIQGYPNNLITRAAGVTTPDGQVRINTSGNHWGWQLGILWKLKEKHRFGYYFRSPVVVTTKGKAKVENSDFSGIGGQGLHNFEVGAHTKMSLPMNMTWSYAFQQSPKTYYEVDFTWSRWGNHKRLYFVTDPAANARDNIILNNIREANKDWTDAFGIQLGASHDLTDKLTLRGGSFFYWTPVPKTSFIPAVPDSNHLAITLGLGYKLSKNLTFDAVYYNSFYFRRRVDNNIAENAALFNSSVDGTYKSYMQSFSFSMTLHWDDLFPRVNKPKEDETPASIAITPSEQ